MTPQSPLALVRPNPAPLAPLVPCRVLLVLTEFPPRIGGMQTHAVYLSRYLLQRGYTVEVVTYQPANDEEQLAQQTSDRQLGLPVHRILSRLGYWHNLDQIATLARRFKPDLVYCSTVFYGLLKEQVDAPLICRSVGNDVLRPWIAYPFRPASRLLSHPRVDAELYSFFRRFDYPELVELLFRQQRFKLMRDAAHRMDRILANSAFTAEVLREIGVPQERIKVLVGGVDAQRFARPARLQQRLLRKALGLPPHALLLLTACRLVAKKGIDFLLPALVQLRERLPAAHLVVVGDGRHAKRYRQQARFLGLEDSVTFAGAVPHDNVHPYFWASDVFVLASRVEFDPATGLRDAETMGRVLCEANAAALPVVTAASGGIPSVIHDGENGLLFTPDNFGDFERQLLRVVDSKDLRLHISQRGVQTARESFDWSKICLAHEEHFAELLTAARSDSQHAAPFSGAAGESRQSPLASGQQALGG